MAISIIYGVFVGKYNFKLRQETITFHDLPETFDGLKILQLSDFHVGSWDNKNAIEKGIELINEQEYDLLVFTGDFVNTLATEANPDRKSTRLNSSHVRSSYAVFCLK